LNAQVVTSERRIAADDYFVDTFETALAPDEIVTAIEYAIPLRGAYAKFRQPASGYAVVGVFIAQYADAVRVGVTGAGASVFRWHDAEDALTRELSEASLAAVKMDTSTLPDDPNASAAYRAHLIETYARRALQTLLAQPLRPLA
jgi:carbon-monoxide dehydrogenase medium subunit